MCTSFRKRDGHSRKVGFLTFEVCMGEDRAELRLVRLFPTGFFHVIDALALVLRSLLIVRSHVASQTKTKFKFKLKKHAIQIRPKVQPAGGRSGQIREGCFLSAGLFVQIQQGRKYETRRCAGVPNGAERSCWTHSRGSIEKGNIPMSATQNCVCSVTTGKRKATTPLASGNAREHAAVPVGCGRPREKAVPRHWHAACLMLTTVRSQNMCRTCSVLCCVFTNFNMSRASPSSLLQNTRAFCHASLSGM